MCELNIINVFFFLNYMLDVCPETKRSEGIQDRKGINPKEGSPKLQLVHGHVAGVVTA